MIKIINNIEIETESITCEEALKSRTICEDLEIDGWFLNKSFASVTDENEITIILDKIDVDIIIEKLEENFEDEDFEIEVEFLEEGDDIEIVGGLGNKIFTDFQSRDDLREMKIVGLEL